MAAHQSHTDHRVRPVCENLGPEKELRECHRRARVVSPAAHDPARDGPESRELHATVGGENLGEVVLRRAAIWCAVLAAVGLIARLRELQGHAAESRTLV